MRIIDICGSDIVKIGDKEVSAWFRVDLAKEPIELVKSWWGPFKGRNVQILETL